MIWPINLYFELMNYCILGITQVNTLSKNNFGQMVIAFTFLCILGRMIVIREQELKLARRILPLKIKKILFPRKRNPFTLYSIVRQSFLILSSIVFAIIILFVPVAIKGEIEKIYALETIAMFFCDIIYAFFGILRIDMKNERKKNKWK